MFSISREPGEIDIKVVIRHTNTADDPVVYDVIRTMPLGATYDECLADAEAHLLAQGRTEYLREDVMSPLADWPLDLNNGSYVGTWAADDVKGMMRLKSYGTSGYRGRFRALPTSDEWTVILKIDGQQRPGVGFTEDLLERGTYWARDAGIGDLSHGPHQFVVQVTDTRGLQASSNPVAIDVLRETDPCSNPLAGEGQTDTDEDGFRDECDKKFSFLIITSEILQTSG